MSLHSQFSAWDISGIYIGKGNGKYMSQPVKALYNIVYRVECLLQVLDAAYGNVWNTYTTSQLNKWDRKARANTK